MMKKTATSVLGFIFPSGLEEAVSRSVNFRTAFISARFHQGWVQSFNGRGRNVPGTTWCLRKCPCRSVDSIAECQCDIIGGGMVLDHFQSLAVLLRPTVSFGPDRNVNPK